MIRSLPIPEGPRTIQLVDAAKFLQLQGLIKGLTASQEMLAEKLDEISARTARQALEVTELIRVRLQSQHVQ
jgi:hypothetical protein